MTETFVVNTPVGKLAIQLQNSLIRHIELDSDADLQAPKSEAGKSLQKQLEVYFRDASHAFTIPIEIQGTAYQQRVWQALREIPSGEVLTYGQLAQRLGSSARAIGNACRRNPTPVIVPCHRVVAASGLGGFAGETHGQLISIKRQLLTHEGALIND